MGGGKYLLTVNSAITLKNRIVLAGQEKVMDDIEGSGMRGSNVERR